MADLLIKAHLDSPLISRPGILESKGHGGVAVRTEGRDEQRLDLVFFLEGDLVIAGVTVKEGEQFAAAQWSLQPRLFEVNRRGP